MSSKQYHETIDGREPSVCGEQPDQFEFEGLKD